ncbi:MAG TPA: 2-oxoglutarate dehydrogenase complex dihydrolipoyllysine-residue succinyltransferase [Thermodesulfobacteriota bacterium]|nr:2-oxoglutarate dehydrogenase complex dihydrolipoyllysine-residue succinyltransferase [Thermodesulfobacteriota bacterium]
MSTNIVVPELGESVVEATVLRWLKREGDRVSVGESVVELETEKANFEVAAEQAGVLVRIDRKEGDDVKVGEALGLIGDAGELPEKPVAESKVEEPKKESKEAEQRQVVEEPGELKSSIKVTPVAKRLAEEHKVDLEKVSATGPGNRITKEDVEAFIETGEVKTKEVEASNVTPIRKDAAEKITDRPRTISETAVPVIDRSRREERIRMSRRRRTIARRMVEAQRTAAILTTFNEINMSAVMELRKRRKDTFKEKHGIGLGINSFFVKATIGALKEFPQLNAEIQEDEIVLKHYYDIGVAIGAKEGLVVPVLRDADRMTFAQIEKAIKEYAEKAENGTLSLEELMGGTFTITNGGVFGSLMSTPILNPPQVGILGLHKIEDRPVVIKGEITIRPMMYVALSYDHRIVDGREAVQFLVRVKELIEDPESLLLEG